MTLALALYIYYNLSPEFPCSEHRDKGFLIHFFLNCRSVLGRSTTNRPVTRLLSLLSFRSASQLHIKMSDDSPTFMFEDQSLPEPPFRLPAQKPQTDSTPGQPKARTVPTVRRSSRNQTQLATPQSGRRHGCTGDKGTCICTDCKLVWEETHSSTDSPSNPPSSSSDGD